MSVVMTKKRGVIMKVFIVDDSALVRERIIAMISEYPGIEITGQAKNAQ